MTRLFPALLAAAALFLFTAPGADATRLRRVVPPPLRPIETIVLTGQRIELVPQSALRAVWTQYGPAGLEARAVVDGRACPQIVLDLKQSTMAVRATGDADFRTLCTAPIPAGTRQAALVFQTMAFHNPPPPSGSPVAVWRSWELAEFGPPLTTDTPDAVNVLIWQQQAAARTKTDLVPLPIPVADPQRIVVIGDTGCRIKDGRLQNCTELASWPFSRTAAEAARLRPDLVIHVGDYVSREQPCPAGTAFCQGMPSGDNWPTWDADFFTPAHPLLAAAPFVFVRGNHEDCNRTGSGYLRLLGPDAFVPGAACTAHLPPYAVPFASLNLVVADDSDAPERAVVESSVPVYRAEIATLSHQTQPTWLLLHRPIWGLIAGPLGVPIGGNRTMIEAVGDGGIPAPVTLMLSGHIHTFEAINYSAAMRVPPQLIAGIGGDLLDPAPADLSGAIFHGWSGVSVQTGQSITGFGFLLLTRSEEGWRIDVYDWRGRIERVCQLKTASDASQLNCPRHE
jgi:hypothetical protein